MQQYGVNCCGYSYILWQSIGFTIHFSLCLSLSFDISCIGTKHTHSHTNIQLALFISTYCVLFSSNTFNSVSFTQEKRVRKRNRVRNTLQSWWIILTKSDVGILFYFIFVVVVSFSPCNRWYYCFCFVSLSYSLRLTRPNEYDKNR